MAENPDVFAPTPDANVQQPNDTFKQQATPAAFGSAVAQGLSKLGAGITEDADFWHGVQTDSSLNGAYKDGQQLVANYQKLRGADAVSGLDSTKAQLEQTFQDYGAKLQTPAQRVAFDNASRAYIDRTLAPQLDHHANEQGVSFAVGTAQDAFNDAGNRAAIHADNPEEVKHARADAELAYTNLMKAKFGLNLTDDQKAQAVAVANKQVYTSQVQALAVKNPAMAQQVLESHKDDLGENYAALAEHLQTRADYDIGIQHAQKAIATAGQNFLNPGQAQPLGTQPASPGGARPQLVTNSAPTPGLTPQANALIDMIAGPESGGQYDRLYQPAGAPPKRVTDLSKFPQWEGAQGPAGISHAAGGLQFEPATWATAQAATGVPDFTPPSQRTAGWWLASTTYQKETGRDLQTDLSQGKTDLIPGALKSQWPSINANSVSRLNSDLQTASAGGGNLPSSAFKASAYDQLMQDPELRDNPRAFQHAISFVNEQASAASIASMQNEQARKQAAEASYDAIATDALNGKMDGILGPGGRIANDKNLTGEQKFNLTATIENHVKKDVGGETKTYGPEFWNAYQRIHLPDSDPMKITSPQQLYSWGPKGDLTMSGIDKLTAEIDSKKTPEGEAIAAMRNTFMKNAHQQISGKNQMLGFADPKGEEQFLKFQAWFLPEFQKQKSAGVSAAELMDPSSSKYLGKNIGAFKRTPEQEQADLFAANPTLANGAPQGAQPENPNAPPADLTTRDGVVAAVKSGQLDYWHATALLNKMGIATPDQKRFGEVPLAH